MNKRFAFVARSIVALVALLSVSLHAGAQNWDINLLKNINPDNPTSKFWRATSTSSYVLGFGVPAGLFVAGQLSKDRDAKLRSYDIAGSVIIGIAITQASKIIINRERPFAKYPNDVHPYNETNDNKSMPSGHTSLAFSTAASLGIIYKKWYITVPAYMWATSVGYSRLYLGAHYPSDVIGGAAVGIGSAYLSHWLNKKLFQRK